MGYRTANSNLSLTMPDSGIACVPASTGGRQRPPARRNTLARRSLATAASFGATIAAAILLLLIAIFGTGCAPKTPAEDARRTGIDRADGTNQALRSNLDSIQYQAEQAKEALQ